MLLKVMRQFLIMVTSMIVAARVVSMGCRNRAHPAWAKGDTMSNTKKAYAAPEVRRIIVRPVESVLTNCKQTTTPCLPGSNVVGS